MTGKKYWRRGSVGEPRKTEIRGFSFGGTRTLIIGSVPGECGALRTTEFIFLKIVLAHERRVGVTTASKSVSRRQTSFASDISHRLVRV